MQRGQDDENVSCRSRSTRVPSCFPHCSVTQRPPRPPFRFPFGVTARSTWGFLLVVLLVLVLILLLLTLSLKAGNSDSVKVSLAVLRDPSATLGVLLEDTDTLKALDDLALNRARGVGVVRGAESSVRGTTVQLSQSTDTNSLAQVNVAGERSGADVVPVRVVGGLLLVSTGLDEVNPGGDLELACR